MPVINMNIGNIIYGIDGNAAKPRTGPHSQPSADDYRLCAAEGLASMVTDARTLIDWHAGKRPLETTSKNQAICKGAAPYDTCGLRVMSIYAQRGLCLDAYLTEIDESRRETLANAIVEAGHDKRQGWSVKVNDDWRKHIRKHVGYANARSISIVDPDRGTDYYDDNLFSYVVPVIFSDSHCLIHMHEHHKLDIHQQMVRRIADVARNACRHAVDLYHPDAEDDDFIHHNFIISDPGTLARCEERHHAMLAADPACQRNPYDGGVKRIVPASDDTIPTRRGD